MQDSNTFSSWGVDFVKSDSCATDCGSMAQEVAQFALMRDALNQTGRRVLFSLCSVYIENATFGNMWRIGQDINSWANVMNAVNCNAALGPRAGPGGFNDPDMLIGSSEGATKVLPPVQARAQFSLWAVMASPLLLGATSKSSAPGTSRRTATPP